MDLVSTVRKEGSRGGRGDFQWSEVQTSQHRENYLGHSLMAPVGRWQKNKDLSWYAKADDEDGDDGLTPEERAAKERREEFQRVKQAEKEALSKALGYEINENGPLGTSGAGSGANSVTVADRKIGPAPPAEAKKERRERHRDRSRERKHGRHHHRHSYRDRSRSGSRGPERKSRGHDENRRRRSYDDDDRRDKRYNDQRHDRPPRRDLGHERDDRNTGYEKRRDDLRDRTYRRRSPSPYRKSREEYKRDRRRLDDRMPDRSRSRSRSRSFEMRRERTQRRSRSP